MGAYNKNKKNTNTKKTRKQLKSVPSSPAVAVSVPGKPSQRPPARNSPPVKDSPTTKPPIDSPQAKLPPGPSSPPVTSEPPITKVVRIDTTGKKTSFKDLPPDERRKKLLTTKPELVLPPIQFITDQDEFSVVNMDSFMQALEFALQGKVILVEGHTDDLGSDAYNLKLSMKRVEKIRQLLIEGGASDNSISVIGFGESQPVVPNTSPENRAKNRRIEFKVFDGN